MSFRGRIHARRSRRRIAPEAMSDAPTLGKRRSSARIAAMEAETAAAAPSLLKRKSSTGLSGPMAALETGAPIVVGIGSEQARPAACPT